MGWLVSLTLEDEVRQDLSLPLVVCENEDVFPDELSGLPPHRDLDFVIKLQEIKFQIQDLLDRGFIRPSTSPWGALVLFAKRKDKTLRLCIDYR